MPDVSLRRSSSEQKEKAGSESAEVLNMTRPPRRDAPRTKLFATEEVAQWERKASDEYYTSVSYAFWCGKSTSSPRSTAFRGNRLFPAPGKRYTQPSDAPASIPPRPHRRGHYHLRNARCTHAI